jgi:large conductance mechanosensitive channel
MKGLGFLSDFKKFAMRGNVIDLAVGVIIGAAFGNITKSMVDDVMMPPLGLLMGRVDFKDKYVALDWDKHEALEAELNAKRIEIEKENEARAATNQPPLPVPPEISPTVEQAKERGIPMLRYGLFINACINFVFVAFAVFLLVKGVMKLQRQAPPPPPTPAELTTSEKLLTEIRDTLKGKPGELPGSPKTAGAPPAR